MTSYDSVDDIIGVNLEEEEGKIRKMRWRERGQKVERAFTAASKGNAD